jgi:hypothetical protein
VATERAQASILKKIQNMDAIDIEFRSCEILPKEAFAFPPETTVWAYAGEEARARALCVDLGSHIYQRNPLGYGGMGLLISDDSSQQ